MPGIGEQTRMSKIMVVDDDIDLAELVQTKLQAEGHEVTVINTGEGAFELAKQFKPDIAILDIMLPGITGYQICRRIRKDPELYRIGILILTALGEEPEMLHGIEQGADDYLSKPFKLDNLIDKIASIQGLLEAISKKHSQSNLPGTEAIKREINYRLARGTALAACYIDMAGFKAYCAANGKEGQTKALAFMSKLLVSLTRNMGVYEAFIAHMGGEHFVVLLNLDDYQRFCSSLMSTFDEQVKSLYQAQDLERGYIVARDRTGKDVKAPIMALSIGVAHTEFRQFKNATKLFEVLAQARQKAVPDGQSVVFVDRRRADR